MKTLILLLCLTAPLFAQDHYCKIHARGKLVIEYEHNACYFYLEVSPGKKVPLEIKNGQLQRAAALEGWEVGIDGDFLPYEKYIPVDTLKKAE